MSVDIDDLEAKAKAATPGPWVHGTEYEQSIPGDFVYAANYRGAIIVCEDQAPTTASAAHIAAVNPAAILELIARLRKAEGTVQLAREALAEVEWDEHLFALGDDEPCDPCDMGRNGEHTVFDHHSVQSGMGSMIRLRRAVEATR